MRAGRKILKIEKSLGFKWPYGISRKISESQKVERVEALLTDIRKLQNAFQTYQPYDLRTSFKKSGFGKRCEDLFLSHGPSLWPPPPVDRSSWLVDSKVNNLDGFYPRDLYYERDQRM